MCCSLFRCAVLATLAVSVSLQGCEGQSFGPNSADADVGFRALVSGTPDGDGHPAVGVLAFDPDGPDNADGGPNLPPFGLCTGSVLTAEAFLTAAHCIEAVPPSFRWAVTLAPGSPTNPVIRPGVHPDDFPFPVLVDVVYADRVVVHPLFGGPSSARRHDVAVVLFPAGTFSAVPPVALPEPGQLDELAAHGGLVEQDFTLVGYGTTPIPGDVARKRVLGYRQVASAPFQGLTPDWLVLQMTTKATGQGALCTGDSGSPHFLGASNMITGLQGAGGSNEVCGTGVVRSQRLDTPAELEFLRPFVP